MLWKIPTGVLSLVLGAHSIVLSAPRVPEERTYEKYWVLPETSGTHLPKMLGL